MSTRIRFTPRPKLATWLEAKAEKHGLPLAATAEQLLFGVLLAEEDRDRTTERPAAAVPRTSSTTAAVQLQPAGPGEGHDTHAQALAAMREREQQTPLARQPDDAPAWQAQAPDEVPSAIRLDGAERYIASNGIAETRRRRAAGELEDYWWSSAVEYALEK